MALHQNLLGVFLCAVVDFGSCLKIVEIPSFPHASGGGEILSTNWTHHPILIAICKIYGQVYCFARFTRLTD
ncbi:MAG: hypothetical protein LBR79_05815 [Oscillospiraceae bacterium]|nr:hypothetical protein [Oscillospiraceae bacterium]